MTSKQIKQIIELAGKGSGFSIDMLPTLNGNLAEAYTTPDWNWFHNEASSMESSPWFPYLIVCAIDGINKLNGDYIINQGSFGVQIIAFCDCDEPFIKDEISHQARLSAVLWYLERGRGEEGK